MKDYKFGIIIRNDDYIMRDHRVHQTRIMPGVTFLDTLYRFIQSKRPSVIGIELRHILFKEPVATSEYRDKKIEISLTWKHDHWKVIARSCSMQGEQLLESDWSVNFECELHEDIGVPVKELSMYSLKQEAIRQADLDQLYAMARRLDIHHYEFMKGLGEVYFGKDYALAEIHLSELAEQYVDYFDLHPAFLDCSTLVSGVFNGEHLNIDAAAEEELKPFIPMYIESVRLSGRLGSRCYVYVTRETTTAPSGTDIQYSNYEIYNEYGSRVAAFAKLTSKKVRKKSLIVGLTQLQSQSEAHVHRSVTNELPTTTVASGNDAVHAPNIKEMIERDVKRLIADILRRTDQEVDVQVGFYDQGLDSKDLLSIVQLLEKKIGEPLYPTLLFEYSNVQTLAEYLAERYSALYNSAVLDDGAERAEEMQTAEPEQPELSLSSENQVGYYVPVWETKKQKKLLPPDPDLMEEKEAEISRILLFAANEKQLEWMKQELRRWYGNSIRIHGVIPGTSFQQRPYGEDFVIEPLSEHDYRSLIDAVTRAEGAPLHILHAWSDTRFSESDSSVQKQLDQGLRSVFLLSRSLMDRKPKDSVHLLYVYECKDEDVQPLYAALDGFAKSIYLENPKFIYKTLAVDKMSDNGWMKEAFRDWAQGERLPQALRHVAGSWQVRKWKQAAHHDHRQHSEALPMKERPLLASSGVYLITGGLGGIGFLVARQLAEKVQAKLILTGRSKFDDRKLAQIRELERCGAEVMYIESDIGLPGVAERVVAAASSRFGSIHGVIHSAGALRDGFVFQKQMNDVDNVLCAKVWGTIYLEQALRNHKPAFFLLFSSLAAVTGNGGQTDYAFANSFMDYFAAQMEMENLRRYPKADHTVFRAINWPLWLEGGMAIDEAHASRMRSKTGIEPLSTSSGLQAMEEIFTLAHSQALVVEGDQPRIMRTLGIQDNANDENSYLVATAASNTDDAKKACEVRKPVNDGHLEAGIAIIGLSGRYPMARDVEQYWRNLRDGVDCIREIPPERWDYREHFHPDKDNLGTSYSKWGGFIEDVDKFDPLFFHISPREAHWMDPQERLFLETVWETIEDAGYAKSSLSGRRVGVFVGSMWGQYQLLSADSGGRKVSPMSIHASIANRVSFFFNFTGPSLALDTMCSSSLTAIYLACESIARGECLEAIAGGVNLSLHPNKYTSLSQSRFFSSDGRCRSFGEDGDGYVPGEGVGAILLKPLRQAEEDGDRIYGVIKGIACNHGGRTGGYSVPNPQAQAEVIAEALRKADIEPRTITYIEAHGTGTSLGDPIEIAGLTRAFDSGDRKQFCAIGSAKSNIGHLESAAGIAGVTKVLLQMKHEQLAPSLHAERLNPNISFGDTPFYVQRRLEEWKRSIVRDGNEERVLPLRAGVSSFGAGGANVHIIIEEYGAGQRLRAMPNPTVHGPESAIIILSAKNKDRLKAQAERLLQFIKSEAAAGVRIADIAYTLQVGREPMEERLGLMAASIRELEEKLTGFVEGRPLNGLYCGQAGHASLSSDAPDQAEQEREQHVQGSFELNARRSRGSVLLEVWMSGGNVDWSELYAENVRPQKVSLPAYPFARGRYWLTKVQSVPTSAHAGGSAEAYAWIHPLLHRNTSHLSELRFSTTFTGEEFFLSDHKVQGRRVLPGVAYIEMARAAAKAAIEPQDDLTGVYPGSITLRNVFWISPLAVEDDPTVVHIRLIPEGEDDIGFEIYRPDHDKEILYSRGNVELVRTEPAFHLPLADIKAQCGHKQLSAKACYTAFKEAGLDYGESHQGIEALFIGEGQLLAKLSLPSSLTRTLQSYVLHPCMMDSALQATIGLMSDMSTNMDNADAERQVAPRTALPFAVEEVHVFGSCVGAMWAWVRFCEGSGGTIDMPKMDIDICDDSGQVLVRMNGFSTRLLPGESSTVTAEPIASDSLDWSSHIGPVLLAPVWDAFHPEQGETLPSMPERIAIIGGSEYIRRSITSLYPHAQSLDVRPDQSVHDMIRAFEKFGVIDHLIWIAPQSDLPLPEMDSMSVGPERIVLYLFRILSCLLELGYGNKQFGLTVLTTQACSVYAHDSVNPAHAAIHGLIGSAANEYKHWLIRLVDVGDADEWPIADIFACSVAYAQGRSFAYRSNEWYKQELIPYEQSPSLPAPYRMGGVYVVIGGAGGIGEAWSEYMIRTYKANIVWIGRRERDTSIKEKQQKLAAFGPTPEYVSADASEPEDLHQAYQFIKQRHGRIHGVIHSAIQLLDKSLASMDEGRFRAGLAAKIGVSESLARVFHGESLDFILFFSSINAFLRAPGQSNYVAGCTHKDAFAHQLALDWPCTVKVMNWGYWGSVGTATDLYYQERMNKAGFGSIEPAEAMKALEALLAGPMNQLAFMRTTKPLEQMCVRCDETITAF
ncbi:SDR family NAD(P)-dependent oxidoreductase [Paenibacillus alvei]|uniref:Putative 3-oxoacyl-[acyl-carrier-protein] reductase n=1 Tax=Paenibacillus alvei TaxID=44250 RepID=A0A383RC47_PAEAL|nr:SDR family NAD(P)-dependent oxidoreductase [Paenibacillus alvei]SYX83886.1 putative 3-oxoacyl-[acyl-carrier-protein] reductase [Paenibacillus alvei]